MTVYIESPAKINLYLEILKIRSDGYHELLSAVQLIELFDEITIRETSDYDKFSDKTGIKDNIIKKAVEEFKKYTGIKKYIEIELIKNIPLGAGLGGGSGNAASVLIGLDKLFNTKLSIKELQSIGGLLGSDVPLFAGGPSSIIQGRGDIVEPLKPRNDFKIILVYPGFNISSKSAYLLWDREKIYINTLYNNKNELKNAYENQNLEDFLFYNSFGKIIDKKYPEIADIKDFLKRSGAVYSEITGSGSAVIGIFPKKMELETIKNQIKPGYSFVRIIKMLDRSINPVLK